MGSAGGQDPSAPFVARSRRGEQEEGDPPERGATGEGEGEQRRPKGEGREPRHPGSGARRWRPRGCLGGAARNVVPGGRDAGCFHTAERMGHSHIRRGSLGIEQGLLQHLAVGGTQAPPQDGMRTRRVRPGPGLIGPVDSKRPCIFYFFSHLVFFFLNFILFIFYTAGSY